MEYATFADEFKGELASCNSALAHFVKTRTRKGGEEDGAWPSITQDGIEIPEQYREGVARWNAMMAGLENKKMLHRNIAEPVRQEIEQVQKRLDEMLEEYDKVKEHLEFCNYLKKLPDETIDAMIAQGFLTAEQAEAYRALPNACKYLERGRINDRWTLKEHPFILDEIDPHLKELLVAVRNNAHTKQMKSLKEVIDNKKKMLADLLKARDLPEDEEDIMLTDMPPLNIRPYVRLPERDEVFPGVETGNVAGFFGRGGTGKSMYRDSIALDVAAGRNGLKEGGVVVFDTELSLATIAERQSNIAKNFTTEESDKATRNLLVVSREAVYSDITDSDVYEEIISILDDAAAKMKKHGTRLRLIVFDTFRSFFSGSETDDVNINLVIRRFKTLAKRYKAGVLFVHHTTKASDREGGEKAISARGSSIIADNISFAMNMIPMNAKEAASNVEIVDGSPCAIENPNKYTRIVVSKHNLCEEQPVRWFKRGENGVLHPVIVEDKPKGTKGSAETKKSASRANGNAAKTDSKLPGTSL